jgi:hypothetical protein
MSSDVLKINDESFDENNPVDEIISLHEEIRRAAETMIQKAIRIGKLLVQHKRKLPHGEFGSWIEDNLPFCVRTGQLYMDIFRNKELLESEKISLLSDAQNFLRLSRSKFKENEGEEEKKYFITFSFFIEQKEVLEIALQLAQELRETRSNSESIYRIAYEWCQLMLEDSNQK